MLVLCSRYRNHHIFTSKKAVKGLTRRNTSRIIHSLTVSQSHSLTVSQSHSLCANIGLSFLHAFIIDFSHQYARKEGYNFLSNPFLTATVQYICTPPYPKTGGTYA